MDRILTDLRNRLTTEHFEQLMKISIEGLSDLKVFCFSFDVFFHIVALPKTPAAHSKNET